MSLNGSQLAVKMLVRYGVHTLFGVPGDTGLAFYGALQEAQERGEITHILARDERSAAFMADAYARVSFRPGVCEGPSGAGAAYLAAGLAEAHMSSIPVIAINSDTPVGMEDRNVLTALDQPALFAPITKWTRLVKRAAQIPDVIRQAFRVAVTGRPGAVQITIPSDVLSEKVDSSSFHIEEACTRYPAYPVRPDTKAIEQAAERLVNATRPVIIAGGGAVTSGAWIELTRLAELLNAPVGTSINGKGAIAEDHPLSMGIVGSNGRRPYANELLEQADLILYVGCKTDSVTTAGWECPPTNTSQTILHLDVDPLEIGRNYPTAVGLVGDARLGLTDLAMALQKRQIEPRENPLNSIRVKIDKFWTEFGQKSLNDSSPVMPQYIIRLLQHLLPADSIIVADAGTPTPFTAAYLRSAAGRRVIIPRGLGGLGYAMAAVVGAKLARPEATVVGLAGDGSFGMSAGELETIVRLKLPITIIHFNNACFGWIKVSQRAFGQKDFGVDFSADTDYTGIARGFGLHAERVKASDELESVLQSALNSPQPVFIDVLTACETDEIPPVEKFHRAKLSGG